MPQVSAADREKKMAQVAATAARGAQVASGPVRERQRVKRKYPTTAAANERPPPPEPPARGPAAERKTKRGKKSPASTTARASGSAADPAVEFATRVRAVPAKAAKETSSQENVAPAPARRRPVSRSTSAPPTERVDSPVPEQKPRSVEDVAVGAKAWPLEAKRKTVFGHVATEGLQSPEEVMSQKLLLEAMETRAMQLSKEVRRNYFGDYRNGVTTQTRNVTLQWMVYIQRKLPSPLSPFTLHAALGLFDRFLSKMSSSFESIRERVGQNLETIAASCVLIASKMEDVWPVDLQDLMSLGTVRSPRSILEWERRILVEMDFDVNQPTALDFLYIAQSSMFAPIIEDYLPLERLSAKWRPKYPECCGKSAFFACSEYFVEVVLMHHRSMGIPTHLLAAGCLLAVASVLAGTPRSLPDDCSPEKASEIREVSEAMLYIFATHEAKGTEQPFAADVDAKHKDACPFFIAAFRTWLQAEGLSMTKSGSPIPRLRPPSVVSVCQG